MIFSLTKPLDACLDDGIVYLGSVAYIVQKSSLSCDSILSHKVVVTYRGMLTR